MQPNDAQNAKKILKEKCDGLPSKSIWLLIEHKITGRIVPTVQEVVHDGTICIMSCIIIPKNFVCDLLKLKVLKVECCVFVLATWPSHSWKDRPTGPSSHQKRCDSETNSVGQVPK